MARNYWFISDTHFWHQNILKWGRNQFTTVEEMNEHIIQKWNSVVKPGDYVYHLGDVWMGGKDQATHHWLMNRLNGSKTLIVGNHDNIPHMAKGGWWRKIELWKPQRDWKLLLSHVPVHESSIQERMKEVGGINLHGHTHLNGPPKGPYASVCCELINYTPVHLEDIPALHKAQQKQFHGGK